MAVVLVMGLLMAIGVPALLSFRASAVSSGSRAVANTLSLARQYAITQRCKTRVVFYCSLTTQDTVQEKRYNTYAVVAAYPTNIVRWIKVGNWESLSLGAVFGDNSAPQGALDSLRSELMPLITAFDANGMPNKAANRTFAYVEFAPTGAANPPTGNVGTISVYEGMKDNTTGKINYAPNKNRTDIVYYGLVGRIRILRQ